MNVASPTLSAQLELATIVEMVRSGELESMRLWGEDGTNCTVAALDLAEVVIEKVNFTAAKLSRITARDVSWRQSDVSSAYLDSGTFVRAEFLHCRMIGVDFNQTSLHDVVFRGCKLDLANFRASDLRRVRFVDCTLGEADFSGARLAQVEFSSCELDRVVFTQTNCTTVDLRSSVMTNVTGWRFLKGAMIDSAQLISAASYLAGELGIIVRD